MPKFATPEPIALTVDLVGGEVRVVAVQRTETVVTIVPRNPSKSLDAAAAEQTRVDFTDGRLTVKAPKPLHMYFGGRVGSVDVTVELPAGSSVRARTYDGDLRCEGEVGDCWLKTSNGDISVHQAAMIHLNTSHGDLVVDRVAGDANVTGSGELRIHEITGQATVKNLNGASWIGVVAGDVSFNSAHGNIVVERPGGDVEARTAFGSIQIGRIGRGKASLQTSFGHLDIGIEKGVAVWLDIKSSAGKVRNELEPTDAPGEGDTVQVRGRTSFGDIVVRHA